MASFDVEPSFPAQLDWIRTLVAEEIEALDLAFGGEQVLFDRGHILLLSATMGLADGPTEVHKTSIAPDVLKGCRAASGPWPSEHPPERRAIAKEGYASVLEV
jgi:hypothetical protein